MSQPSHREKMLAVNVSVKPLIFLHCCIIKDVYTIMLTSNVYDLNFFSNIRIRKHWDNLCRQKIYFRGDVQTSAAVSVAAG